MFSKDTNLPYNKRHAHSVLNIKKKMQFSTWFQKSRSDRILPTNHMCVNISFIDRQPHDYIYFKWFLFNCMQEKKGTKNFEFCNVSLSKSNQIVHPMELSFGLAIEL